MNSLEADIACMELQTKLSGEPLQFRKLCQEVFQTPDGQRLLALLCTVRHPLNHSYCADARLAAHEAGQREVIAALWRNGAALNSVPELPSPLSNPNNTPSHDQNRTDHRPHRSRKGTPDAAGPDQSAA